MVIVVASAYFLAATWNRASLSISGAVFIWDEFLAYLLPVTSTLLGTPGRAILSGEHVPYRRRKEMQ